MHCSPAKNCESNPEQAMPEASSYFSALAYDARQPLQFYSLYFIAAFSVFYLVYVAAFRKVFWRNALLLLFSLFLYYKISGPAVLLLLYMGTSDYLLGLRLSQTENEWTRKFLVGISLITNIGSLLFFKYINFFLRAWFNLSNGEGMPPYLDILLPIGISFFVFKSLSYIFDLYREVTEEPETNWVNYLLFVSFFPNIMAGPICKARFLLPQLREQSQITSEYIGKGFLLILVGSFKKIVIADYLANNFMDRVFAQPDLWTGLEHSMAMFTATIHFYFDFSGYTDMVIGIALLLGFTTETNFNKPMLAQNVSEFWRRWHITLSNWFNEYVYMSMAFSWRAIGKLGLVLAVLITFLISGLWHGPDWTFILWGGSHGLAIAWDVVTQEKRQQISQALPLRLYKVLSIILTTVYLSICVVLFKSGGLDKAQAIYAKIFTDTDWSLMGKWIHTYPKVFTIFVLAWLIHYIPTQWYQKGEQLFIRSPWFVKAGLTSLGIFVIYQFFSAESKAFIYLEF